ncbi:hypothetical protein ACS60R_05020 [Streptococcus suis]|nr:hypothetical protein [Streptococcus suis]HEL2309055.1 hypothetical protein [Streptococcus suis]HEL2321559.1 hypothetical protein [Streptococcus suis]HEM3526500.1 hypothetical protein [Streptococcus suis]
MKFLKSIPLAAYLAILYLIILGFIKITGSKDISIEIQYIANLIFYGVQCLVMVVLTLTIYIIREVRKVYEKI